METIKNIVILGAGETGIGTALLAIKQNLNVFVSDSNVIKKQYLNTLKEKNIEFESGQHSLNKILNADLIIKSPGIPDNCEIIKTINKNNITIISEIEFAAQYTNSKIVGITGSNGKTTTTMLAYHILKKAGYNVAEGGNIGNSFARLVAEDNYDYFVLELSSFQLDGIVDFAPHIAIITNITPDHLDRYNYDFEQYTAAKFRITMNQTENDFLIYDANDPIINQWLSKNTTKAKLIPYSFKEELGLGTFYKNNHIHINLNNKTYSMNISKLSIKGEHNIKNTMSASTAAKLLNVRKKTIRESFEDFEGAPHRLEEVLTIGGVKFINDSKATNINSVYYALSSINKPIIWIVGGQDKGNNYMEIMPLVREKVKAIVCLGVDNSPIIKAFENVMPTIVETFGAEEAVNTAYKLSEKGDNVLLSPACASFDLFKSYEDRGNQFKAAVLKL